IVAHPPLPIIPEIPRRAPNPRRPCDGWSSRRSGASRGSGLLESRKVDAQSTCLSPLNIPEERMIAKYRVRLVGIGLLLVSVAASESTQKAEAQQDTPQEKAAPPPQGSAQQPAPQERQPVAGSNAPRRGKPNILVIMGDDVGWLNISAYHQGI